MPNTKNISITNNVFFYLVKILQKELKLGYINKFQNIDFHTLKIKTHKKRTKKVIVNKKIIYISNYKIPVMEKSLEFIRYLNRKLDNERIQEIKQHKNNKLLYFKLDHYYLIFEFFSKSNIILTDLDFKVISARRYEKWKDRNILRNKKYGFPKCEDIKELSTSQILKDIKNKNKKDKIRYFVKKYKIAPYYLNKIYKLNKDIKDKEIILNIKKLFEFENFNFKLIKNQNKEILIVEEEKKENKKIFEKIQKRFFKKKFKKRKKKKDKKINKIKAILNQQNKAYEKFEKEKEEYKRKAEIIYENFTIIEKINKQIKLALDKNIKAEDIKKKINNYFLENNINLKIKEIDLKNRNYLLKVNKKNRK